MSFIKQILHPCTTTVHPNFHAEADFIATIPQRFAKAEGELMYKGRNELRILSHKGIDYVVKSYRRPIFINRCVYGLLRPSKANRAYKHAQMLLDMGVGTPAPVAYINIRSGLLFDRSYLITLRSTCPHTYNDLFYGEEAHAEAVSRAVGHVTAKLHQHGCALQDYGRGNILYKCTPTGVKLEMVDINRMRIGKVGMRAGCRNFERLPATSEMHRWMADEYAKARGFDADECFRLITAYRSTQPGKIDGKY